MKSRIKIIMKLTVITILVLTTIITPVQVLANSGSINESITKYTLEQDSLPAVPQELANVFILDANGKLLVSRLENSLVSYQTNTNKLSNIHSNYLGQKI